MLDLKHLSQARKICLNIGKQLRQTEGQKHINISMEDQKGGDVVHLIGCLLNMHMVLSDQSPIPEKLEVGKEGGRREEEIGGRRGK